MAVTKTQFKTVAERLFTDTFLDFATARNFTKPATGGTFDPVTGGTTGGTAAVVESIPTIREEYTAREFDGQAIQVGDFKLLSRADSFVAFSPRTDGVSVDVDGLECRIVTAEKDAADAVWTMQVRAK